MRGLQRSPLVAGAEEWAANQNELQRFWADEQIEVPLAKAALLRVQLSNSTGRKLWDVLNVVGALGVGDTVEDDPTQVQFSRSGAALTGFGVKVSTLLTAIAVSEFRRIGQPTVRCSGSLAAQLCLTSMAGLRVEDIRFPWPAFLIDVGSGSGLELRTGSVRRIFVAPAELRSGPGVEILPLVEGAKLGETTPLSIVLREELSAPQKETMEGPAALEGAECFKRITFACRALVISVLLSMAESDRSQRPTKTEPRVVALEGGPPIRGRARIYNLDKIIERRKDEEQDRRSREALRGYVVLGRRLPTGSWLVRGHWRLQPYGRKMRLRRRRWIEPHWKGQIARTAVAGGAGQ